MTVLFRRFQKEGDRCCRAFFNLPVQRTSFNDDDDEDGHG